jgi:hypothetical protein
LNGPAGATALRPVVDTRRVLPVWKPQGTGLLKMAPEYARAVNIPLQTVANNEGVFLLPSFLALLFLLSG